MNELQKFLRAEPLYLACRWHDWRIEAHDRATKRHQAASKAHHAATVRLSARGLTILRSNR